MMERVLTLADAPRSNKVVFPVASLAAMTFPLSSHPLITRSATLYNHWKLRLRQLKAIPNKSQNSVVPWSLSKSGMDACKVNEIELRY